MLTVSLKYQLNSERYAMSWSEFEYSIANGQPLTLYEFIRQGNHYRYTNADRSLTVNGETWEALAIRDSGLSAGSDNNVEITLPITNKVVSFYRGVPPSTSVKVRIYRMHYQDDSQTLKVVWVGNITEVKRENIGEAKIITTNIVNTFGRQGLRLTFGRNCPHSLYDGSCRVKARDYVVSGLEITAFDGKQITINMSKNITQGYFSGGYIEYQIDGLTERRGIRVHDNNTLSLFGGTHGLSIGQIINVYPGCNNTIETCSKKFNNHLNYGGCPHMPGKSPYNVTKLF